MNTIARIHLPPSERPKSPRMRLWKVLSRCASPRGLGELFDAAEVEPGLFFSLIEDWISKGVLTAEPAPLRVAIPEDERWRVRPPQAFPSKRVAKVPKFSGRQRIWSALKVLREADLQTICLTAEVTERSAQDYLMALGRLGYVSSDRRAPGEALLYRLDRFTGPKHPVVRFRKEGFVSVCEGEDRNQGKTYRHELNFAPEGLGKRRVDGGGVS